MAKERSLHLIHDTTYAPHTMVLVGLHTAVDGNLHS